MQGPNMAKLFLSKFRPGSGTSNAGTDDFDTAIPRSAVGPVDLQYAYCVVLLTDDCNHDNFHKQVRTQRKQNSS